VPLEECTRCPRREAIHGEPVASVECTIPVAPEGLIADPEGERTEVGSLLCGAATVVEQALPLRDALRLLHDTDRRSVAVVDGDQRLIGIVHETAFIRIPRDKSLALARSSDDLTVAMSTAIAINEATPIRTALRLLASSHLREATVVGSDGRPIGVFRDVDGLHWIARAKAANGQTAAWRVQRNRA
jgi:predicted transcriptional regulator